MRATFIAFAAAFIAPIASVASTPLPDNCVYSIDNAHSGSVMNVTENVAVRYSAPEGTTLSEIETALDYFFEDDIRTTIRSSVAGMTDDQLTQNPNYTSLPATLQALVRKRMADSWAETDPVNPDITWDDAHARRFRVQSYEPYSPANASWVIGVTPYSNLNNPTGILSDNGTTLYIWVDKEVATGSHLTIRGNVGLGDANQVVENSLSGVELHKGLNIVECNADTAHMYIYYWVETAGRRYKLSDFEDLVIHIEGGSINGYYDSVGDRLKSPDTLEDWFYYRDRARHEMFDFISRYTIFRTCFYDVIDYKGNKYQGMKSVGSRESYASSPFNLNASLDKWDEMFVSEKMLMGTMSDEDILKEKANGHDFYDPLKGDNIAENEYYEYFNSRLLNIIHTHTWTMNATQYRVAYHTSHLVPFFRNYDTGDNWISAHEFGHLNQMPILVAGTNEISNNLFSNVFSYYRKSAPSLGNSNQQRTIFNQGGSFYSHGDHAARMWHQLWLYYHAAGKNKKFYPRLYELLRRSGLRKSAPRLQVKDDLLHLAKQCCVAAQEDLTDFFEAWGCFTLLNGLFIDGAATKYNAYLTADDVRQWKAEIAQMAKDNNWKKNDAILFIDERVSASNTSFGTMGSVQDYVNGAPVTGQYSFSIIGNRIRMFGATGGVGFAIFDENDRLIGFGNCPEFDINSEAASKLANGIAKAYVIDHDNTFTALFDPIRDGDLESKIEVINSLLETTASFLDNADPRLRNVGYFLPEVVADLRQTHDEVTGMVANGSITDDNAVDLFTTLTNKYLAVKDTKATPDNTVPARGGAIYVFTRNQGCRNPGITTNGTSLLQVAAANVNMEDEAQQWRLEPVAGKPNYYYLRNVKFGKYVGRVFNNNHIIPLQDTPVPYMLSLKGVGRISLSADGSDHDSLFGDNSNRITRWDSDHNNSQWTLTLIEGSEVKELRIDLEKAVADGRALLEEAGTVRAPENPDPVVLSPEDLYTNAPCTVTTWNDHFTDKTWSYLFDDNTATIFHSEYGNNNTADGLNHYIRIRIPDDVTPDLITLGYRTRQNGKNAPTKIEIQTSSDGNEWYSALHASGLSTAAATDVTLPSVEVPTGTRYLRMMVNEASPNSKVFDHPYFVISELRLYNSTADSEIVPKDTYPFIDTDMMRALYREVRAGADVLASPSATPDDIRNATEAINSVYAALKTAMERNNGRLREMIDDVRALTELLGDVKEEITPIKIDEFNIGTLADNSNYRFSYLLDNDLDTYYQTSESYDPGEDHFFYIMFHDTFKTDVRLTYTTSPLQTTTYAPVDAEIQYSFDWENWITVAHMTDELPVTHSTKYMSAPFSIPPGVSVIRFIVHKNCISATDNTDLKKCGHSIFALSELGLETYVMGATPDVVRYPDATADALVAAISTATESERIFDRSDFSADKFNEAYDALLPHYERLLEIAKNRVALPEDIDNSLEVAPVAIAEGTANKTVTINLHNPSMKFNSAECVVVLPQGISIATDNDGRSNVAANATSGRNRPYHSATSEKLGDGIYRVACSSERKQVFYNTEGAIIDLPLAVDADIAPGIYDIEVTNVKLGQVGGDITIPATTSFYSSMIVGNGGETVNTTLHGTFDAPTVEEFSAALAGNGSICSIDLSESNGFDDAQKFTTANPNTIHFINESQNLNSTTNVVVLSEAGNICSDLEIVDGHPFNSLYDFNTEQFSYARTYKPGIWQALYLPCGVAASELQPLGKIAELTAIEGTASEPVLVWTSITDGYLEANRPYIFKPAFPDVEMSFKFADVEESPEEGTGGTTITSNAVTYSIRGNFLPKNDMCSSHSYALSGGNFCPATSDAVILSPMRIYLNMDSPSRMPAKIKVAIDGVTTSDIEVIEVDIPADGDDTYFDLMGRRIANPADGIFIKNNKKIFINQ